MLKDNLEFLNLAKKFVINETSDPAVYEVHLVDSTYDDDIYTTIDVQTAEIVYFAYNDGYAAKIDPQQFLDLKTFCELLITRKR